MFSRATALAVATALLPGVVLAQSFGTADSAPVYTSPAADDTNLSFTVRGGLSVSPDYFGSNSYTVGPDFALRLGSLNIPGWRSFGNSDTTNPRYGFAPRVSFRYISDRDDADNGELSGLEDIDRTFELGGGLGYRSYNFDAFADLRYGFGGSESWVSEVGADIKLHPNDDLVLRAGPRVLWGADDYASTYFDVTDQEAAQSRFDSYDADGGVISTGVELGARYDVGDNWGVEGAVTYDRLVGDAADSPIVEEGDRDQYGVRLGVTRSITLGF